MLAARGKQAGARLNRVDYSMGVRAVCNPRPGPIPRRAAGPTPRRRAQVGIAGAQSPRLGRALEDKKMRGQAADRWPVLAVVRVFPDRTTGWFPQSKEVACRLATTSTNLCVYYNTICQKWNHKRAEFSLQFCHRLTATRDFGSRRPSSPSPGRRRVPESCAAKLRNSGTILAGNLTNGMASGILPP